MGKYDIVIVAIPCQPSSTANPHKTPDNARLVLAMVAVNLACELNGRVTIVGDVAAFDNTQSDAYNDVIEVMGEHHKNVEVVKKCQAGNGGLHEAAHVHHCVQGNQP